MKSFYFRAARAVLNETLNETAFKTKISKSSIHRIENLNDLEEIDKNNYTIKTLIDYYRSRGIEIGMEEIIILTNYEEEIKTKSLKK